MSILSFTSLPLLVILKLIGGREYPLKFSGLLPYSSSYLFLIYLSVSYVSH